MPIGTAAGVRTVHSLDDLRAVATVPVPQWRKLFVREAAAYVYWAPESSEADDGDVAIQPTDRASLGGRWVRPTSAVGLSLPFAFDQWNRSEDILQAAGQVTSWPSFVGPADLILEVGFGDPAYNGTRIAGRPAAVYDPALFDLLKYDADIETNACDQLHVIVYDADYHCSQALTERYYLFSASNNDGSHNTVLAGAHTGNGGDANKLKWAAVTNGLAGGPSDPDRMDGGAWHPFRRPSAGALVNAVRGPQIVVMLLRQGAAGVSKMWRASMWDEDGLTPLAENVGGYEVPRPYYAGSLRHTVGCVDNADAISTATHFRGGISEVLFKNVDGITVTDEQVAQIVEFFRAKYAFTSLGHRAPSAFFVPVAVTVNGGGSWFEWNHRVTVSGWADANAVPFSQASAPDQPTVSNGVTVWTGGTKNFAASNLGVLMSVGSYEYWVVVKATTVTATGANRWTNHLVIGDVGSNWWLTLDNIGGTLHAAGGHFGIAPSAVQHNAVGNITINTWHVIHVRYDGTTDTISIDIDGVAGTPDTDATDVTGNPATQTLRMGDSTSGTGFIGKIAEFACYPLIRSAPDAAAIQARMDYVKAQVIALGE